MLPKGVREILKEMREERIRGASYLAKLGAKAFLELGNGDPKELCSEIVKVNPSMAPLQNLVLEVIKAGDPKEGARKFLEKLSKAKRKVAKLGSRKIRDGDTIITHSYSSAVLSAIKRAWEDGKKFNVMLSESQPDLEGLHFASELKKEGIPFKVITESQFILFSKEASLGMCGADCITLGGYVFNKSGTSFLAFSCYYHGRPFYILAESYKIHPKAFSWKEIEITKRPLSRELSGMKFNVENFLFDWTPPTLITSIITDKGEFKPEEILKALKRNSISIDTYYRYPTFHEAIGVPKGFMKFDPLRFLEMKGLLKYLILYILNEEPMHGYGIIQLMRKGSNGLYTPSPGVIYPALQHLEKEGLIRSEEKDGKKIYFVTEKGKEVLEKHREEVERIIEKSARMKELIVDLNLKSLIFVFKEVFKVLPYLSEEEKKKLKEIFERTAKEIREILRGHRNGSN